MELPSGLCGIRPQNFCLKNLLYVFLKNAALTKCPIFSQKNISYMWLNGTSLYFLKRKLVLYFRKMEH